MTISQMLLWFGPVSQRKIFDERTIIVAYIVKNLELQLGVRVTPKHSLYIFVHPPRRKNSKHNLLSENHCQNYENFYQRFNISARN